MSQCFLLPLPRARFFDADGLPLAFGKAYFYAAGTSNPIDTFSNSDGSSTNTNPVILSASGEATIFLAAATLYKMDLYDANNVQQPDYPVDGIEAIPAPDPPAPTPAAVPTGGIIAYGGSSAPSSYLLCTGANVSRTTYATLFGIIGTTFGAGDGSTTFGLPDLQQRFPLGKATSGTGSTLGGSGGTIDHTHTGPSHTHAITLPRDGWGNTLNTPSTSGRLNTGDATGTGQFNSSYQPTADQSVTSAAGGTGVTGTANAPFLAVNYLIKT